MSTTDETQEFDLDIRIKALGAGITHTDDMWTQECITSSCTVSCFGTCDTCDFCTRNYPIC